jgi:uncharacterized protein (DUF983 family)
MKRIIDEPYSKYSVYSAVREGISVRCPKCGKHGLVTFSDEMFHFRCAACLNVQSKGQTNYRYSVHNACKECGRYYKVEITDNRKQHIKVLNVNCPYCSTTMSGEVQKDETYFSWGEIKGGVEPFFGYPLYFQGNFDGKLIWALNRGHLQYLIDYLEADLREKPKTYGGTKRTQADQLPTFMKLAKNRDGIVKMLKKMQTEESSLLCKS